MSSWSALSAILEDFSGTLDLRPCFQVTDRPTDTSVWFNRLQKGAIYRFRVAAVSHATARTTGPSVPVGLGGADEATAPERVPPCTRQRGRSSSQRVTSFKTYYSLS